MILPVKRVFGWSKLSQITITEPLKGSGMEILLPMGEMQTGPLLRSLPRSLQPLLVPDYEDCPHEEVLLLSTIDQEMDEMSGEIVAVVRVLGLWNLEVLESMRKKGRKHYLKEKTCPWYSA